MTDEAVKQRQKLEAQIERWTAEAKKRLEAGNEAGALELYCQAADELPGAPWLQHRTAELSRKLKKQELAIVYFRRAATAFQLANFAKRAVAPLRTAWTLAVEGLPGTSKQLVDVSLDLIQVHRRLGFAADATVTLERTNAALRGRGFSELSESALDALDREPPSRQVRTQSEPPLAKPSSSRPTAGRTPTPPATLAAREVAVTGDAATVARSRALARLLARR